MFSGAALCPAGVTQTLCHVDGGLGTFLAIYTVGGAAETVCFTPTNPHLSRTLTPTEIYRGPAILKGLKSLDLAREKHGDEDAQVREVTVFSEIDIPLGSWAYLTHNAKTVGYMVTGVMCDLPGVRVVKLDAAKIVPFTAASVGL